MLDKEKHPMEYSIYMKHSCPYCNNKVNHAATQNLEKNQIVVYVCLNCNRVFKETLYFLEGLCVDVVEIKEESIKKIYLDRVINNLKERGLM